MNISLGKYSPSDREREIINRKIEEENSINDGIMFESWDRLMFKWQLNSCYYLITSTNFYLRSLYKLEARKKKIKFTRKLQFC